MARLNGFHQIPPRHKATRGPDGGAFESNDTDVMKTKLTTQMLLLCAALPWLAVCHPVLAATNVVILGDDFQQKIDAAAPGDTLVVQSGTYSGNLNFTKPLTIVCSGTNGITFTGNSTISASGIVSFVQTTFSGPLGVQTNATLVLSLTTNSSPVTLSGGSLQAFDSQFQGLSAAGGKVTLKRCGNTNADITLTNTAFEALRLTTSGNTYGTAQNGSGTRFVAVQSYLHGLFLTGYQNYLGYNSFSGGPGYVANAPAVGVGLMLFTDCDTLLVGNLGGLSIAANATVVAVYGGTLKAYNNRLRAEYSGNLSGLFFRGAAGEVVNNSIDTTTASVGDGIPVQAGGGPVMVKANAINSNFYGIYEDAQQITECSFCCIGAPTPFYQVAGISCLITDPQFRSTYDGSLSATNTWLSLLPGSPCSHAGPPQAIYNNTDGTRNTIGYSGGPLWNPANYTNDSPIIFWSMPSSRTVLKGRDSTIQVQVGASAGH